MLRLDSTLRKLEVLLAAVVATTQPAFVAAWSDGSSAAYTGGMTPGNLNSTTPVTLVAAPASGVVRDVDYVSLINLDTAPVTATVRYNDNSTTYKIITVTLQVGEQLCYTHGSGWQVTSTAGAKLTALGSAFTTPVTVDVTDTAPALRVSQAGSGYVALFEDTATADSTPTVIDASGNIGIGTLTPQAKFSLLDAGSTQALWKTIAGANDLLVWDSYNASAVKAIYSWRTEGTELMRLNNLGSLGIGSSSLTGWSLRVEKSITGSTAAIGCGVASTVLSDVTSDARYFRTSANTQAAAFTLTTLTHFYAAQSTIGAGSTVTNQYGFQVESNLTGATNNYGFFSNIASSTGRWNFYANGTADNYFAGRVGIGIAPAATGTLHVQTTTTGATTKYGIINTHTVANDVTAAFTNFPSTIATAAGGAGLTTAIHFDAAQGTFSGTVTTQYGYRAQSTLTGATNNFGFYSDIASGSNRWNFYANGTAANAFAGVTTFGAKMGYGTFSGAGGSVTQLTSKATGVTLNTPSGQITMNNAALAANTTVSFTLTNSSIAANDTVICHRKSGGTAVSYNVWIDSVAAGSCVIAVQNITAGSLSEAVVLQFDVVAGATS